MGPVSPPSGPSFEGANPERRWLGALAAVAVGLTALVFLALLYYQRPEGQIFFPRCSFYEMTGWLCPGCGGLRATHALLHGRLAEAARCNALFVVGVPAFGLVWLGLRRWRGRPVVLGSRTVWILVVISALFTVVRNLPLGIAAWLVP